MADVYQVLYFELTAYPKWTKKKSGVSDVKIVMLSIYRSMYIYIYINISIIYRHIDNRCSTDMFI